MLAKILSFFVEDERTNFSFYRLYTKLKQWAKEGTLPWEHELPQSISFESTFWKKVIEIHKATKGDDYERAFSVFWADGELVITGVTKGSTSSVTTNSVVGVKYSPSRHKGYLTKTITVDSNTYSTKEVYHKNVPSQLEVKYLFNVHTHPRKVINNNDYYGFFSITDLNSLINSNAIITGMITDKFWLLVKTNKSPKALNNYEQNEVNTNSLIEKIRLGVYSGDLGGKLHRHTLQLPTDNVQVST